MARSRATCNQATVEEDGIFASIKEYSIAIKRSLLQTSLYITG